MDDRDVIIVGAGSAGCVLAARLSEDPARRVLLLEAGPDYAEFPEVLLDGLHGPSWTEHDWGLAGSVRGRPVVIPRGRVVGGSSAVNACFALRGSPHDYDRWNLPGWSFDDLLPSFVRLEHDHDFGSADFHGDEGPIPVSRCLGDQRSRLAEAATEALVDYGVAAIGDHNAPYAVGVAPLPRNVTGTRRANSATAYLDPARHRENLVVRGDSPVHHVAIDNGRAVGVVLEGGSTVHADRVIVATGAYASPGLLRRSGLDLPGIGQNLIDHPAVSVDLPYHGPIPDLPQYQLVATLHSSQADTATDPPDLQVLAVGPFPAEDGCGAEFALAAALLKPRSRGSVGEHIDLNYLDDPDDMRRMLEGLDHVLALVDHPAIRDLTQGAAPSVPGIGEREAWVRERVWSYHHPVGTCAMGSVVDERGEVYGVASLSVIDASMMPDIPSANTHLPVTAIAEHLAATAL